MIRKERGDLQKRFCDGRCVGNLVVGFRERPGTQITRKERGGSQKRFRAGRFVVDLVVGFRERFGSRISPIFPMT
jgi:hypothetical protein